MKKPPALILVFAVASLLVAAICNAQDIEQAEENLAIEYFDQIKESRDIESWNITYDREAFRYEHPWYPFKTYFGVTATYAKGEITQIEGDIDFEKVYYYNSASGIGPGGAVRITLYEKDSLDIKLNGSGYLIFYNKKFPAGGEFYNFMGRIGPEFAFHLQGGGTIGINLMWTHVSNGTGLGNQNPAYEAKGIGLRYSGDIF